MVYIATFLVHLSDGITQDDDVQQLLYFLPAMEFKPLGIPAELCSYAVVNRGMDISVAILLLLMIFRQNILPVL